MQLFTKDIVDLILQKFNIEPNVWLRKPRGEHAGWTNKDFIELLVIHGTGPEIVRVEACGEQTVNRALAELISPITGKLRGGNETFRNKIFYLVSIKKCPRCEKILSYEYFNIDRSRPYGVTSVCKVCESIKNAEFYSANKDRYHNNYIDAHRSEYNARNAKRRSDKIRATPIWANLDLIKYIYACAEDAHVDHIIPLNGDTVCGLHVENNLQYLTPVENLEKSNKLLEKYTNSNFT